MGEQAAALPIGAYAVHTGPAGPGLTFEELKVAMSRAVQRPRVTDPPARWGGPARNRGLQMTTTQTTEPGAGTVRSPDPDQPRPAWSPGR